MNVTYFVQWAILQLCFMLSLSKGWIWECDETSQSCQRRLPDGNVSFYENVDICRLVCDPKGNLWPQPSNFSATNRALVYIAAQCSLFSWSAPSDESAAFLEETIEYFKDVVNFQEHYECKGYTLVLNVLAKTSSLSLNWDTNEAYQLVISTNDSVQTVEVNIVADSVFGVRHGIETFLQLIPTFDSGEEIFFLSLKDATVKDEPYYKHRGLLLDSARNYLSLDVIKRNIVAMAVSKMNVLHWHLSDTQSFPFISKRLPNMSSYGAYSNNQTYTPSQITELIKFAKLHGVRIIPEIDGPAHAGSGWQWGPDAGIGDLVVCYNQQPYRSYCIQPPCGQMNPANPNLYSVLTSLYADLIDLWPESDVVHMGGDEVFVPCWNSSDEILDYIGGNRSEEVFLDLWGEYQRKALDAYDAANQNATSSIILWTSTLTDSERIERYLPNNRYVIQTWVPKSDPLPEQLEKLGYKLIISTKDSWYLDHGFWGSTLYYNWRTVYDNTISTDSAVLGGEVCMWGELADDNNVESKVWPRAAAAAERLWSNPSTSAIKATPRFFSQNDRLARRGLRTSPLAPEYCTKSDIDCTSYILGH